MADQQGEGRGRRRRRWGLGAWPAILLWTIAIPGAIAAVQMLNIVKLGGFPLGYWGAAQGGLLLLLLGTAGAAWRRTRSERAEAASDDSAERTVMAGRQSALHEKKTSTE